ncbi:hypothetical protein R1flu_025761 [Riccia fluitans]|uniref:Methyltransferase small domain-containing protein n=1 Tax=Riccia fluitans TaxID=41844 RepID=A0ABD1XZ35_9MARC
MAALARGAGLSPSRFPCYLFKWQISRPVGEAASYHSGRLRIGLERLNLAQSAAPAPLCNSAFYGHHFEQRSKTSSGIHRCSSSNRLAEQEVEVPSDSGSSLASLAVSGREKETKECVFPHFEVAVPLCERSPSSVASLTDLLVWRKQAQDLASSVGFEFSDRDGGPEVSDLLRELEWFLDDSVGACAPWAENLDVQSSSWKFCSWRDVKDCFNLKLENGKVKVSQVKLENGNVKVSKMEKDDSLTITSPGNICASSFGAFADLSKDRYGDPVTEFATDCGCSCDGIREDLVEMNSLEELESGPSSFPSSSTLKELSGIQKRSTSSSEDRQDIQLLLRMSLPEMETAWKQRILARKPFQYMVAAAHWRDLVLSVMEGVLIPRPETEQLVDMAEMAISNERSLSQGLWADLGTGSGAIAIGVARLLQPSGSVVAVDASTTAVAVARRNVERYRLQNKVKVVQGFWFSPLQDKAGKLAGVISNPPYIPTENLETLQAEVGKNEPKIALDGGADGTDDLRKICNGSAMALRSGGFLALETNGGSQAEAIRDYLSRMRFLERSGKFSPCFCDTPAKLVCFPLHHLRREDFCCAMALSSDVYF